ncbi:site-specific integrase [Dyadobacter linearis]|nr:site-specific integrase [Dyadobacter sp. CECT 9623]
MIYLGYRFGQDQLIYSTGIKVLPKHWDFTKSRVKNVVEVWDKDDINAFLRGLTDFTNSVANTYKARREDLTKQLLKRELDNYIKPPKAEEQIKFFDFFEKLIIDLESGKRLLDNNKIADPKTIQRYRTAKNSLQEFEQYRIDKLNESVLHFDHWTEQLWNEYISYLTFVKSFKVNNIGFYQKQLKIVLKAARKAKLYTVGEWLEDVKILAETPVDIFLNKSELLLIETLDLSNDLKLDRVRDLFFIGCYTGFRISDWKQVSKDNIKSTREGNKYIEIIPEKANATHPSTPLHSKVVSILDKYDGRLPIISEQKFNVYVKDLCKLAGIDEKVTTKYVIAGRVKIDQVPKYSQVTSHTARRSFATNEYLDSVPVHLIMKATGHTTERNFLKYLKLDNSGAVDAMAKHKDKSKGDKLAINGSL